MFPVKKNNEEFDAIIPYIVWIKQSYGDETVYAPADFLGMRKVLREPLIWTKVLIKVPGNMKLDWEKVRTHTVDGQVKMGASRKDNFFEFTLKDNTLALYLLSKVMDRDFPPVAGGYQVSANVPLIYENKMVTYGK